MNILILTNSYTPFVGGLERSVALFTSRLRSRGHRVLIVTPDSEGAPLNEEDVVRVPAIQHFNGTDFSVQLPVPGILNAILREFRPDLVHSQHPFLIGDTALRIATESKAPLVFTFHTFFEHYTHYTPVDSPQSKRFVAALATGYSNLCDSVIAPSESVRQELQHRGVTRPISVVPTGIDVESFKEGDGQAFRAAAGIPPDAFVAGIVSRIAPEKNLGFLTEALMHFMTLNVNAHFLMIGDGPSAEEIKATFTEKGFGDRFHAPGTLQGRPLLDGYHAMNVFVFASFSETQGLVLTEAMAAGVPVIALDGPGVRDVLREHDGGRLIMDQKSDEFVKALQEYAALSPSEYESRSASAQARAADYSHEICTNLLLDVYRAALSNELLQHEYKTNHWKETLDRLQTEWHLFSNVAQAAHDALAPRQNTVQSS